MTIEQRVELLEKELARTKRLVRWLPGITILVCLLAFGLFEPVASRLFAQQTQKPGEVIATKFTLVDSKGEPRVILNSDENSAGFVMYDNLRNLRALLSVDKDGPHLDMYDKDGDSRVLISGFDDNTGVRLFDKNENNGADITVNEVGAALRLFDSAGDRRVFLLVAKEGQAIALSDSNGKTRAQIALFNDVPSLDLFDSAGNNRVFLSVDKDGPSLDLSDSNGKTRANIGTSKTNTGDGKTITYPESSIILSGPDGSVTWEAP